MDHYKAGNWYVPSIAEMSMLISHRINSTTTATNADESTADWYSETSTYTGKGIFKDTNKLYFDGFLNGLKDEKNNFAYITSDVVTFKNVVYTSTSTYWDSPLIGWKAQYSYYSHQTNYLSSLTESYSCRRDRSYTLPMCCQITIKKDE
jgi:hypothetical protein